MAMAEETHSGTAGGTFEFETSADVSSDYDEEATRERVEAIRKRLADSLPPMADAQRETLADMVVGVAESQARLAEKMANARVTESIENLTEAMGAISAHMARRWLESEDVGAAPVFGNQYPLMSPDPVAQERAAESYREKIDMLKEKYGTIERVADLLGISRGTVYNHKKDPAKLVELEEAERVCELLGIDMDELRGQTDPFGYLSDGTTFDRLLTLDVWKPKHVREVYKMTDKKTRRAITHMLKTWLTLAVAAEAESRRDNIESLVRDVLKSKIPSDVWEK